MEPVSIENAEHYLWGDACEGWHLLRGAGLHVIRETVPPGKTERRHLHRRAEQFFFILAGRARMEIDGQEADLGPGQGLPVAPGTPHRFFNPFQEPVEFLVISCPTTRGDRQDL